MNEYLVFTLVGFVAQLIDGGMGMGYGLISMTVLLAYGIAPPIASAGVHTAEIVTTGISGLSHMMFKNVDRTLFKRLAIPGMLGGVLGAFFLSHVPAQIIKPFVTSYLFLMAIYIVYKTFRKSNLSELLYDYVVYEWMKRERPAKRIPRLISLGLTAGFLDAAGGGGWGPIVNSTLLAQGEPPRYTIGSVNLAEFLVALGISTAFFFNIGIKQWPIVVCLIAGGALAAPIAAYMVKKIPRKLLMIMVAVLIMLLCLRSFWTLLY
ncbi:sulfite exporter TauE/SafE family protein [Legionella jordanis]|uniref:Probable membrane transporter protein n=1 Tax=Legionella jordanis TaxID=456 RepID=A0A0W0VC77_9GAMM|nr:sulfite exporter TauE/SafE family protein [Legionella jordanis]KTD17719.1 Sulfite exporter TauE/SafE [Legionella jordanis]RMX01584.1 sulfite exporter TauE/SafE family protein [Legionella jordanis]RMX21580.1 sulfite exporter TauE/SafE family protein [Legionella jordanis]VEH11347.1 Sulfite exporter TauE/SafE [Legionella jordanis]HAT8714492.1 TSUP family transporter [Legionella jordanis]